MRGIDFTSWQNLLITLFGLALVTLISIGIRLVMMLTIQQRRERMNRQINERLRALIAAYKTLGGSFTGNLTVDPTHLRELHRQDEAEQEGEHGAASDRRRRIRDAVEAALSDIILLGTDEQVRLASAAVRELVAGRPLHTADLVVSLRAFIRQALDLSPIPPDVEIPVQGPARPPSAGGRGKGEGGGQAGGRGSGSGMGGGGMGGLGAASDDQSPPGPG